MAALVPLCCLVTIGLALTIAEATTYTVGDSSGWDISSNLDTWTQGKTFLVGDALVFQYSSSYSVDEVTKQNYDNCNTTNTINSYTNGNTTVPLTTPGPRYFICGNKLYCLGGMKLQVNVETNQTISPASAPQQQPSTQPSSKSDNPSSVVPSSAKSGRGGSESLVTAFLGFVVGVASLSFHI